MRRGEAAGASVFRALSAAWQLSSQSRSAFPGRIWCSLCGAPFRAHARSFGRPAGGKTPRLSGLPGVYCPAREWRSARGVGTGRVLSVERLGLGFEERAAGSGLRWVRFGIKSQKSEAAPKGAWPSCGRALEVGVFASVGSVKISGGRKMRSVSP